MKTYHRILRSTREYLLAGLGIIFPLFISLYIIYFFFSVSYRFLERFINAYLKDVYGFVIPGLGIFIILLVLIVSGGVVFRPHFSKEQKQ